MRLQLAVVESDNGAVLSEAATVEVLAYLITAARTQIDEAAEYAPMRLITAAQKLGSHMAAGASGPVRDLLGVLETFAPTGTPRTDRAAYVARLDTLCVALADCLLMLAGSAPSG
jgi:Family of unknown function (DUF6092)